MFADGMTQPSVLGLKCHHLVLGPACYCLPTAGAPLLTPTVDPALCRLWGAVVAFTQRDLKSQFAQVQEIRLPIELGCRLHSQALWS